MRPHARSDELKGRQDDAQPEEETEAFDTSLDDDEDDLDESHLGDADDGRWDAFILDDDGDPLPEYGDFWFPD